MDKEILEDFRLKVKDRLAEYLKKSNLPLDNSSPIRPTTICPCCGKKAEIITYPVEPPTINWRCTVCMEIGDAIRFAKEYYRMNTDEQAIVDICRKLGIQITTLSTFTAEELIRMDFPPLQELIEGMLAPGLYILAGASKIGKSWLVLQIAHHISTGLPLWDRKTVKGDVLYLSLEDTLRRIQSRLLRICDGETGNITFATEAELIGNGFEKQIHNYMRHYPKTKLIIIDTLIKVRDISWSSSVYADDYACMTVFKHLAEQYDIAIVLVHHTRKQESQDIMEMISGTNGIMGCADGAMVLERPKRLLPEASLNMTSRDFEDARILLRQDKETMCWEYVGYEDEQPPEASDPVFRAISEFMVNQLSWQGTAQTLLDALKQIDPKLRIKPNFLSRKLNDEKENLREFFGINVSKSRSGNEKLIILEVIQNPFGMCDVSDA